MAGIFARALYHGKLAGFFADLNLIAGVDLVRRNIHAAAIHVDMAMTNYLAGLAARNGKAQPENHVIKSPLKLLQQEPAGDARLARRFFEVVAELVFQGEIHALGLLYFPELQAVTNHFGLAVLAMLAGSEVALFHGAFISKTLGPF